MDFLECCRCESLALVFYAKNRRMDSYFFVKKFAYIIFFS